ncbi:MAG: deoxyribonuclease IV, partial [Anaerolineae bacterium]
MVRLGAHMSIAGGVDQAFPRALAVGCETMQIFTKSANQWQARPLRDDEVARFHRLARTSGVCPGVADAADLLHPPVPA